MVDLSAAEKRKLINAYGGMLTTLALSDEQIDHTLATGKALGDTPRVPMARQGQ